MRLFLVRHGQTEWNRNGLAQGHTDTELDSEGRAQAECLARSLGEEGIKRIYSSDLKRCLQTAQPLASRLGLEICGRPELRERRFGEFEGTQFRNLGKWFAEESARTGHPEHLVATPGGESWQDVWDRLDTVMPLFPAETTNLAVFSHGGTCRLLLAKLVQAGIGSVHSFRFWNTGVTELELVDGVWRLNRYNDTRHLEGVDESQTA